MYGIAIGERRVEIPRRMVHGAEGDLAIVGIQGSALYAMNSSNPSRPRFVKNKQAISVQTKSLGLADLGVTLDVGSSTPWKTPFEPVRYSSSLEATAKLGTIQPTVTSAVEDWLWAAILYVCDPNPGSRSACAVTACPACPALQPFYDSDPTVQSVKRLLRLCRQSYWLPRKLHPDRTWSFGCKLATNIAVRQYIPWKICMSCGSVSVRDLRCRALGCLRMSETRLATLLHHKLALEEVCTIGTLSLMGLLKPAAGVDKGSAGGTRQQEGAILAVILVSSVSPPRFVPDDPPGLLPGPAKRGK
ncbi:hypothetical protein QBC46DRAFT_429133 [Diplogelasinospora grovesii]|uniref:Uncharacterized protein n=1 Tax=Diplogelasinospora grovesii TaxID=303347 RepID=A0AAN6N9W3_9PEZI|nr:hypothetical protein QBC46DRAFT_429133 [Diplogelasinospora grovesii]